MKRKAIEVAHLLRREIEAKEGAGGRLDVVTALAARFETSVNTILEALGILERDGLVERRRGSGVYIRPQGGPRTVGILVEHDILHPRCSVYHTQVVRELRLFLARQGLQTNLYVGEVPFGTAEPEQVTSHHFLSDLAARRLDGVAVVCSRMLPDLTAALERTQVPVVSDVEGHLYCSYVFNWERMVAEGVRLLAAQGRRRLALMAWHSDSLADAFRHAMAAAGLPLVPGWVRDDLLPEWPGAGWEEFREIWTAHDEKPDGLLVTDDILFRDAMTAIRGVGVALPEQLSIVAHATRGADITYPESVTRLEIDPAEAAALIGGALTRLLAGKPLPRERPLLPFRIIPVATPLLADAAGAAAAELQTVS